MKHAAPSADTSEEIGKALEAARAWLVAAGDPLETALAEALLGLRPRETGEAALAARQDADGAPCWDDADPALDGSVRSLHWLRALGRADGAVAEAAAAWLASRQQPDGGIGPGEPRSLVTARVLAALSCTARVRASVLTRAGEFLAQTWSPDALSEGGAPAVCAWFPALCHAPGELADFADAALQWCGREFEKGFRSGRIAPAQAAAVFADCDAHALPGTRLGAGELAEALMQTACPDGSFPGGPRATLEALRALHVLSAATGAAPC